ncbi:MAG: hypothetical protein ACI814_000736 [Mariniblastus sp.]
MVTVIAGSAVARAKIGSLKLWNGLWNGVANRSEGYLQADFESGQFFYRETNESPAVGQDYSSQSQRIVAKMSEFDPCLKRLATTIR